MNTTEATATATSEIEDWVRTPWHKLERHVYRLQKRIYRAQQEGNRHAVHSLQRLLMKSTAAQTIAVRRVTQDNQGKKTAGVDGVKSVQPADRLAMVKRLHNHTTIKAQPVRRVYIPKPGKDEKRPLGIPVMLDRAHQALVKLTLEPQWEARFDKHSYGFRPGRSCHDAIEAIFREISRQDKYVLDADIKGCFDNIDHHALLVKLDVPTALRQAIRAWLKAGVLDGLDLSPTTSGTPQGGVISPLLANIALHGIEGVARDAYRGKSRDGHAARVHPTLIRYADDFVVLCAHRDGILAARQAIEEWLGHMGLHLHPSKTKIVHTLRPEGTQAGFDFLGFNVRQYPVGRTHAAKRRSGQGCRYKTIIKPSKDAIKRHMATVGTVVRRHRGATQEALIGHLKPLIMGWCNYYRTVVASDAFSACDHQLFAQLWRWAKRRHPKKSRAWIARRYWSMQPGSSWDFVVSRDGRMAYRLRQHKSTSIKRHVKVRGAASPFDGDLLYWSQRLKEHPLTTSVEGKLLQRQQGKCGECGLLIRGEDLFEVDHVIPRSRGGNDLLLNKQVLHRYCHHRKTADETAGYR